MEKAEILEMTVAYVRQLHGARCRSPSTDVITGSRRQKSRDNIQEFDSSSDEYRAGFNECLVYVQRFLADQAAAVSAQMNPESEVALPQLLINHLSQFVDGRRPKDSHLVVRSSPPSPDTTLIALPPSDPAALPPLSSTSPAVKFRPNFARTSTITPVQTSSSLDHRPLPSFLFPFNGTLRQDRLIGDVGMVIEQPLTSDNDTQCRLRNTVFVTTPAIIQPSSDTPFSLSNLSISMSMSSQCSSPQYNSSAIILQSASRDNADHDVWRPWRPETSTCSQCSDVSCASST